MKKISLLILILIVLGGVVSLAVYYSQGKPGDEKTEDLETQCQTNEMIFYFHPKCGWCNKVKEDGTIPKIEELGIAVTQIDITVGPVQHEFSGVPTFVINDQVYSGYRTFEQLEELLGC